jgi:hypothetical protein
LARKRKGGKKKEGHKGFGKHLKEMKKGRKSGRKASRRGRK